MKHFIQKSFTSIFQGEGKPNLIYVFKTDDDFIKLPCDTHIHENFLEILFIRHGSGIHTIAGKQYEIKKGDILIYNSKILHNHYINSDTEMSIYGCAVSNVKIEGLKKNSLILDSSNPILHSGISEENIETLFTIMYSQINFPKIGDYLACALISMIVNQLIPIKDMKVPCNKLQ